MYKRQVKDGEIIGYDDETAIVSGDVTVDDYWTMEKQQRKKVELGILVQKYLNEVSNES